MLPSHGQITAAIQIIHWAGQTLYLISHSHVFDKQAETLFVEFLNYNAKIMFKLNNIVFDKLVINLIFTILIPSLFINLNY